MEDAAARAGAVVLVTSGAPGAVSVTAAGASEGGVSQINPALLRMLRCPLCKGTLSTTVNALACGVCRKSYPIVLGIPDMRVYEDPLISLEDDYRKGDKIEAQSGTLGFADLVRFYWSLPTYPPTPPDLVARFTHHVLTDERRIEGYRHKLGRGERFLDVGCGTAALVKAAQRDFRVAVGCDVAFRWLLIARKRLEEAGLPANLVCCCADYLPFADGWFDTVASVSLLEHVPEAGTALEEFARVLREDGRLFVWTANRFSLATEPHVRVWGVGFLPRRWMAAYVRWRRGMVYEKKYLLSWFRLRRLLRRARFAGIEFSLPVVTAPDWDALNGVERFGARLAIAAARVPLVAALLVVVSPVLQAVARRGALPERSAP